MLRAKAIMSLVILVLFYIALTAATPAEAGIRIVRVSVPADEITVDYFRVQETELQPVPIGGECTFGADGWRCEAPVVMATKVDPDFDKNTLGEHKLARQ